MTDSLAELDSTAVHVLRRLLRGERVPVKSFVAIEGLHGSRTDLLRGGYVYERSGAFELTARGKALHGAIHRQDRNSAEALADRRQKAAADARARKNGPALLAALIELVAATDAPELENEDDVVRIVAAERVDAAYQAAEAAIKTARGE